MGQRPAPARGDVSVAAKKFLQRRYCAIPVLIAAGNFPSNPRDARRCGAVRMDSPPAMTGDLVPNARWQNVLSEVVLRL